MTRIIYSLYIDIPEDELDYQPPHYGSDLSKTLHTKIEFKKNYSWLKHMQEKYANAFNIEYKLFEYDKKYKDYHLWFTKKYPQITSYNIVNFYKIHLMYELSKTYEEILYLDFDAIPIRNKNFFDYHDLNKGIHILTGTTESQNKVDTEINQIYYESQWRKFRKGHSNRSPTAKYWNARAMCVEDGIDGIHTVYNTGIVGINKNYLQKLDYFNKFDRTINLMTDLIKEGKHMYPLYIHELFGYDNECIWAYKTLLNNVDTIQLNKYWHHFMDKWSYIPDTTNIVHCINKNFKYVREYCEKNNL